MRAIMVAVSLGLALCAAPETPRFTQDRFVISSFVDPPLDDNAATYYRDMAEAHFNMVIGIFGANSPEALATQRELCRKHGMQLIANTLGLPDEELPEGPEIWGYFLRDEPWGKDFPELAARVASLREHRPGRLAYINLFPSYCDLERLGAASYDEHVQRFVDEVNPDVLCMDHYPFMLPDHDTRDAYCADLETMRKHSVRVKIPFWNYFNTMPFGPHGDPTEAQIRWQAFTSVAYGAKGVLYFCYWTPRGAEFPKGGAILTAEGRKTHHYGHALRTNAVLAAWGPTIMQTTGLGATRVQGGPAHQTTLEGPPLSSLSEGTFVAGQLQHEDGRLGLVLVNHDTAFSAWPTINFDREGVLEVDRETGEPLAPVDDSPDLDGLQLSFEPGAARFFLLPAKDVE